MVEMQYMVLECVVVGSSCNLLVLKRAGCVLYLGGDGDGLGMCWLSDLFVGQ